MTKLRPFFLLALAAWLLGGANVRSESLHLGKLPLAVRKAVRDLDDQAKIEDITQAILDGEVRYTLTLSNNGANRDIVVAENGKVKSAEIPLEVVPPTARSVIRKTMGRATLESVATSFEGDTINYDVMMINTNGAQRSFTVELNGTISNKQIDLDEAPFAVRAAIKSQLIKLHANLTELDWTSDKDGISYDVTVKTGDQSRELSVLPTGQIDSIQVFSNELPQAGQQTLTAHLAGGKLARIDIDYDDDGTFLYDVQVRANGNLSEFYITPDGTFQATDD